MECYYEINIFSNTHSCTWWQWYDFCVCHTKCNVKDT